MDFTKKLCNDKGPKQYKVKINDYSRLKLSPPCLPPRSAPPLPPKSVIFGPTKLSSIEPSQNNPDSTNDDKTKPSMYSNFGTWIPVGRSALNTKEISDNNRFSSNKEAFENLYSDIKKTTNNKERYFCSVKCSGGFIKSLSTKTLQCSRGIDIDFAVTVKGTLSGISGNNKVDLLISLEK